MRLEHLKIENYRGFESLELDFHPEVTVLVGANGSGKTSVLEAIVLLLANDLTDDDDAPPGFTATDARAPGDEVKLSLKLTYRNDTGVLRASYAPGHPNPDWFDSDLGPHFRMRQSPSEPVSIAAYYDVTRYARDSTPGARDATFRLPPDTWKDAWSANAGFHEFFQWFREREDIENAERIEDSAFRDPQLNAVRRAIEALLPGYTRPRVRRPRGTEPVGRDRPSLVVTKAGLELSFDQLSGGERVLVALAGDIARRLAIADPKSDDPLRGEGVVLIDEVDLHLHPQWQARVIPALRRTFPGLQFVVSTHSLIALSYVASESVRLLQNFELVEPPSSTRGREPNALASEIYGIRLRPPEIEAELARIAELIDAESFDQARADLESLSQTLGDTDTGVIRLQTALALEEA